MKKTIVVILVLAVLTAALVSCTANGKSAKDCSAEVVSLMSEMITSEKYAEFYSLRTSYEETLEKEKLKSGNYSSPLAIYELSIPEESLMQEAPKIEDAYKELDQYVKSSLYTSFASLINKGSGTEAMVVSSVFSAKKTFVCEEIKKNTVYLYVYENGYPIVITFIPGESGSVRVSGQLIINDDFYTDDAAKIESSCAQRGIRGVVATKK